MLKAPDLTYPFLKVDCQRKFVTEGVEGVECTLLTHLARLLNFIM